MYIVDMQVDNCLNFEQVDMEVDIYACCRLVHQPVQLNHPMLNFHQHLFEEKSQS